MISAQRITSASGIALADVNELLKQLRHNADEAPGTQKDLDDIASNPQIIFIAAKDDAKTIGMGTAYLAVKFGKKTGFVEDVVVSEAYRGQGLGQRVMEMLIAESKREGVSELYLTSRADRIAANKLYQKLGFQRKETNLYQLKF